MSFSFNGLAAEVTITGDVTNSLLVPSSGQTPVHVYVNNQTDNAAIYTVPANKVFYMTGYNLSNGDNAAQIIGIKHEGSVIIRQDCAIGGGAHNAGSIIHVGEAGDAYTCFVAVPDTVCCCAIWGFLVDA